MNHTHHVNNRQISGLLKLLAGCLAPVALIFVFVAMGVEYYSIGGFIPYLLLLFCPIAYLMLAYPGASKQRMMDNIKRNLSEKNKLKL